MEQHDLNDTGCALAARIAELVSRDLRQLHDALVRSIEQLEQRVAGGAPQHPHSRDRPDPAKSRPRAHDSTPLPSTTFFRRLDASQAETQMSRQPSVQFGGTDEEETWPAWIRKMVDSGRMPSVKDFEERQAEQLMLEWFRTSEHQVGVKHAPSAQQRSRRPGKRRAKGGTKAAESEANACMSERESFASSSAASAPRVAPGDDAPGRRLRLWGMGAATDVRSLPPAVQAGSRAASPSVSRGRAGRGLASDRSDSSASADRADDTASDAQSRSSSAGSKKWKWIPRIRRGAVRDSDLSHTAVHGSASSSLPALRPAGLGPGSWGPGLQGPPSGEPTCMGGKPASDTNDGPFSTVPGDDSNVSPGKPSSPLSGSSSRRPQRSASGGNEVIAANVVCSPGATDSTAPAPRKTDDAPTTHPGGAATHADGDVDARSGPRLADGQISGRTNSFASRKGWAATHADSDRSAFSGPRLADSQITGRANSFTNIRGIPAEGCGSSPPRPSEGMLPVSTSRGRNRQRTGQSQRDSPKSDRLQRQAELIFSAVIPGHLGAAPAFDDVDPTSSNTPPLRQDSLTSISRMFVSGGDSLPDEMQPPGHDLLLEQGDRSISSVRPEPDNSDNADSPCRTPAVSAWGVLPWAAPTLKDLDFGEQKLVESMSETLRFAFCSGRVPVLLASNTLLVACVCLALCSLKQHVDVVGRFDDPQVDTTLLFMRLSDLIMSFGALVSIPFLFRVTRCDIAGQILVRLEGSKSRDGVVAAWCRRSLWRLGAYLLAFVIVVGLRFAAELSMYMDTWPAPSVSVQAAAYIRTGVFAASVGILMVTTYCIDYTCCATVMLVNSFCFRCTLDANLCSLMQDWNVMTATLRCMASQCEPSFAWFILAVTASTTTAFLAALSSTRTDMYALWVLAVNAPLGLVTGRLLVKAAEITERCRRTPSMVNSMDFHGKGSEHRFYLVNYISLSNAGFFVKGVLIDGTMVLKIGHLAFVAVIAILSRVLAKD